MEVDNIAELTRAHIETPRVPDAQEAERLIRHRMAMRWLSRGVMLLALGGLLALVHWLMPHWVGETFAIGALAGGLFGLMAADLRLFHRHQPETVTEVISQDLDRLEQ